VVARKAEDRVTIFKAAQQTIGRFLDRMTFSRSASSWLMGLRSIGRNEMTRSVGDGLEHNVLMSPIMWAGRMFPEGRLCVRVEQDDGEAKTDRGHDMVRLVRKPNPFYDGDALWMATLVSYFIAGEAYWLKVRGAGGRPGELWYAPHWMMTPQGDEKTFITHYDYSCGSGMPIPLDPSSVIHFRFGLDPRDPRHGMPPLRPLLQEVFSDSEAAALVSALLRNRGVPGLLISPDKDVSIEPGDGTELSDYVDDRTSGANRGKALVLTAATKVQQFGFSPSDMDMSALRNVSEERVCAGLGIRAVVVGFGAGLEQTKVGATMKEEVKLSWTGCLLPTQRNMAQTLTNQLLSDFKADPRAEAAFDNSEVEALREDRASLTESAARAFTAGIITRARAKAWLSEDVLPGDDVYMVPINLIETPVGTSSNDVQSAAAPAAVPPVGSPAPAIPAQGDGGQTAPTKAAPTPGPASGANIKRLTTMQVRVLRAKDRAFKRWSKKFTGQVKSFLDSMGSDAERLWLNIAKDAQDDERVGRLMDGLHVEKRRAELRAMMGQHYVAVHEDNLNTLKDLGIYTDATDLDQLHILSTGGRRAGMVDLSSAARDKVMEVLAESRSNEMGVTEVAARIRSAISGGPFNDVSYRAALIARTETRYAQSVSSLSAYKTMEGVDQVMILDARLGPTDAECEAMDGQVVSFEEAQKLMDDEHPNGTRDVVPVFA